MGKSYIWLILAYVLYGWALWVMIKFANTANDVTVLAVKIDVVLKLHEKTVKLVGLRSKKITYERRKNTLLGKST